MGITGPRKRLALDTNVLFDLAAGHDFAFTFKEVFQEKGYELALPPTVIQELTYLSGNGGAGERHLAETALTNALKWGLKPFDLVPVGHGITDVFANKARKTLLPEDEYNDALILAETALCGIRCLVTSDQHLLGIDPDALRLLFEESDLVSVAVAHPRSMLKALR